MSNLKNFFKFLLMALIIIFSIQLINKILGSIQLILGAVLISLGVLSLIWTLLARYNLSPKSQLRLFANNFLAVSISILLFTTLVIFENLIPMRSTIYLQYLLILSVYFFLILASYYMYSIGKEFGFKGKSLEIKKHLKEVKKSPKVLLKKSKKKTRF